MGTNGVFLVVEIRPTGSLKSSPRRPLQECWPKIRVEFARFSWLEPFRTVDLFHQGTWFPIRTPTVQQLLHPPSE